MLKKQNLTSLTFCFILQYWTETVKYNGNGKIK